jgi:hypothetical protein
MDSTIIIVGAFRFMGAALQELRAPPAVPPCIPSKTFPKSDLILSSYIYVTCHLALEFSGND